MKQIRMQSSCLVSGFTLVEILISMAILGIVGLAIFSMQIQSIRTAARSASMTEAGALATQELEMFQSASMEELFSGLAEPYRSFDALNVFPPTEKGGWDGEKELKDVHGRRSYRLYWNVAMGDVGTEMEGLAMLRMEVHWEEYGQPRRLQFDLLKTDVM